MKKNIRDYKVNGKQFAYFIDCVSLPDEDASDKDKITAIWSDFCGFDYPNNKRRFPNLQDRFTDWLQGLPTGIDIDIWPSEIIKVGQSWGYCQTPAKEAKFVENWWGVAAFRYIQLAKYFGVKLPN